MAEPNGTTIGPPPFNYEINWPRPLRYSLLLAFDIPAIGCSLLILFHLFIDRSSRQALNNHTIMILLVLTFSILSIDIPFYIDFARNSVTLTQTPAACLLWWFVDIGCYNSMTIMFAWTSVERHILVFHDRWLLTFKKRFLIHYTPLIVIIAYLVLFYLCAMFAFPCENTYIYTLPVCGNTPCYALSPFLAMWDIAFNGYVPAIIVILANAALFFRVLFRRQHLRQGVEWRKNRIMIIQMLSIAALYIPIGFTTILIDILIRCSIPVPAQLQLTGFFLTYWIPLLLPFVCLLSMPKLRKQLMTVFEKCKINNQTGVAAAAGAANLPATRKANA